MSVYAPLVKDGLVPNPIKEITYQISDFGSNTYIDITTPKRVAYILYGNVQVTAPPIYFTQSNQVTVRVDVGEIPTSTVIVGFFK